MLLASETSLQAVIEGLAASLGYVHQGDLGIPGREAFKTLANDAPHNLYVCPPSSVEFRRHIAFRDFLRAHPIDAKAYGELKLALAAKFRDDRTAYLAGKDGFITELTKRALTMER